MRALAAFRCQGKPIRLRHPVRRMQWRIPRTGHPEYLGGKYVNPSFACTQMQHTNTARAASLETTSLWDYPDPFIQPISPGEQDIDGLEHTNNAVYVQWCEAIAWAHSATLGLDLQAYRTLDRAMAIHEAHYEYLQASTLGDELLLGTWLVGSDGRLTLQRRFQIIRPRDNAVILRGQWELVCIEISSGRARRMPEEFCKAYLAALVPEQDVGI